MLYIIAYDIPDNKRRLRVAKILLDVGDRLQYSVFACGLDAEQLARLCARLKKVINTAEDHLHIFRLCESCKKEMIVLGKGRVIEEQDIYIV